jgi:hypothetical protein
MEITVSDGKLAVISASMTEVLEFQPVDNPAGIVRKSPPGWGLSKLSRVCNEAADD